MIQYKNDVLSMLRENGYNTTRLRKERLLGESTLQQFRTGQLVSWLNMDRLCRMLHCQPGDIIEYVPDETEEGK